MLIWWDYSGGRFPPSLTVQKPSSDAAAGHLRPVRWYAFELTGVAWAMRDRGRHKTQMDQQGTIETTHGAVNDSSDALGDCEGQRQFVR